MRRFLILTCVLGVACGSDDTGEGIDPDGGFDPTGDAGAGVDASQPTSGYVDPSCTDGMYSESLPDVNAGIADIVFNGDIGAFVDDVLARRYPVGSQLVAGGRTNTNFGQDCDVLFSGSPSNADELIGRLNTIVHECGHLYDFTLSSGSTSGYYITDALTLSCERGDTTERGGDTFARSRLNGDAYSALRPPCPGAEPGFT
jgi:hypothetical protein